MADQTDFSKITIALAGAASSELRRFARGLFPKSPSNAAIRASISGAAFSLNEAQAVSADCSNRRDEAWWDASVSTSNAVATGCTNVSARADGAATPFIFQGSLSLAFCDHARRSWGNGTLIPQSQSRQYISPFDI